MKKAGFPVQNWLDRHIGDQSGRRVLITGANSGLGLACSRILAERGAQVFMACRSLNKAEAARKLILEQGVSKAPVLLELDLSSLDSVASMAAEFHKAYGTLDVLINNAGLMALPPDRTAQGFEMQMGVNHFGHFALGAALWPALEQGRDPRLVVVGSMSYRFASIRWDDIHWKKAYSPWGAYGMSKLANMLYMFELAQRKGRGASVMVNAAHPGYIHSELTSKGPLQRGNKLGGGFFDLAGRLIAMSPEKGALPLLYAACSKDACKAALYGPAGAFSLWGFPTSEQLRPKARSAEDARRLWELSRNETGFDYPF